MGIQSYKVIDAITVRASAALPAAGAYDTSGTATAIDVKEADQIELVLTYTRGAAGGRFKIKIQSSVDSGTTYGDRTIDDGGSLSSGSLNSDVWQRQFPTSSGAAAESFAYIVNTDSATHIKVLAAETGVVGTPGTLAISAGMRKAVR